MGSKSVSERSRGIKAKVDGEEALLHITYQSVMSERSGNFGEQQSEN